MNGHWFLRDRKGAQTTAVIPDDAIQPRPITSGRLHVADGFPRGFQPIHHAQFRIKGACN